MTQKRRSSRPGAMRLVGRVREAIDQGVDSAESIHKKAAHVTLVPLEGIDALEAAVRDVRRIQDRSIGAVYDLVRSVNHELGRLAERWLAPAPVRPKRRRARRPARVVSKHHAA